MPLKKLLPRASLAYIKANKPTDLIFAQSFQSHLFQYKRIFYSHFPVHYTFCILSAKLTDVLLLALVSTIYNCDLRREEERRKNANWMGDGEKEEYYVIDILHVIPVGINIEWLCHEWWKI